MPADETLEIYTVLGIDADNEKRIIHVVAESPTGAKNKAVELLSEDFTVLLCLVGAFATTPDDLGLRPVEIRHSRDPLAASLGR
jgi:hypothetical protein